MSQKRTFFSIAFAVIIALLVVFWFHYTQKDPPVISEDDLSQELVERWGAGLPDGFEKMEVKDIKNGKGYLFARLAYRESAASLLKNWETVNPKAIESFYQLLDEYTALPNLSEEHQALLSENRPSVQQNWIFYTMTDEENAGSIIFLLYDKEQNIMYLIERQI